MIDDVVVPISGISQALEIARRLGLKLPDDAAVSDGELVLSGDWIDRAIHAYVRSQPKRQSTVASVEPRRIDRAVKLGAAEEAKLAAIQRNFGADARGVSQEADSQAVFDYRNEQLARLRLSIITPIAQGDVSGITCVYGGELAGALTLEQPCGEALECDTLIHLSHPCSPEDLHLREMGIRARRIYRYHVPGLDDAAWARQNEPLRWPMTALEYRQLLALRANQQL